MNTGGDAAERLVRDSLMTVSYTHLDVYKRQLLGSTQKMGAGTNVQTLLAAEHHLDVPWRPSDIEQREGRAIRQGNTNKKVFIHRYVTEGTFDSYSWQLIETKQRFISQVMSGKAPSRSCCLLYTSRCV